MFVKKSYPEENKALWFDRKIHRKIHKKAKRQTLRNGFSLLKIADMQSGPRCQTYHRFLRWMIFLPGWMLSQVLKVAIGRVYS